MWNKMSDGKPVSEKHDPDYWVVTISLAKTIAEYQEIIPLCKWDSFNDCFRAFVDEFTTESIPVEEVFCYMEVPALPE